jgi:hypothetical protein
MNYGFLFLIADLAEGVRSDFPFEQIMRSREGIMVRPPYKVFDLAWDAELPNFSPQPLENLGRRTLTSAFFSHGLLH